MTHTVARTIAVVMTVLVTTVAGSMIEGLSPAHADDTDKARRLLQQGDKYMRRGDQRVAKGREKRAVKYYERALAAYQKAHELVPKPSIFFAIANAEAALGRHMDAMTHYQKVLDEVDSEELQTQTRERMSVVKQSLVTVAFKIEPEGAELSVNAELRGVAPIERPIYLAPGEHTFTVTAEGYTPHEETLTLEAGNESEREIALEKIPVIVKKPTRPPPRDEIDGPRRTRPKKAVVAKPGKGRLLLTGGVAIAMFAGATVTGFTALSNHDTFKDESASQADRDAARSTGKTMALVTDLLTVGGIAAAAYTTYYYLKVYRPRASAYEKQQRKRDDPDEWSIAPYMNRDGGGLAVTGRF